MWKLRGKRAVIVGGGAVARRRAAALIEAGAVITVVAPRVDAAIESMAVRVERREYRAADLDGAALVVIATDVPGINEQVARDAAAAGVLANRADEPEQGDLIVPAHMHIGPLTISVSTGGISARAAAVIRDQLVAGLDRDWVRLLEAIEPYRPRIQAAYPDAARRGQALGRLVDGEAMELLKHEGVEALRRRCEAIVAGGAVG